MTNDEFAMGMDTIAASAAILQHLDLEHRRGYVVSTAQLISDAREYCLLSASYRADTVDIANGLLAALADRLEAAEKALTEIAAHGCSQGSYGPCYLDPIEEWCDQCRAKAAIGGQS